MRKYLTFSMIWLCSFFGMAQTVTYNDYQKHIAHLDDGYNYKKYPHIEQFSQGISHPHLSVTEGPRLGYVRWVLMNPANRQNRTFEHNGEYGAFLDSSNPKHQMVWDNAKKKHFVLGCGNEVIHYVDFLISDQSFTKISQPILGDCCNKKGPSTDNGGLFDDWSSGTGMYNTHTGIELAPLNNQQALLDQQLDAEYKRKYKLFFGAGETNSGFVNILEGAIRWGLIAFGGYLIYDWISDSGGNDRGTPRPPNPDPDYNPGDTAHGIIFSF